MRVTIEVDDYYGDLNRTEAEAFLRQLVRDDVHIAITDIHIAPIDSPELGTAIDPVVNGWGRFTARVWLDPKTEVDETEGARIGTLCKASHPGKTHAQWKQERDDV